MQRRTGMHPQAFKSFIQACYDAGVSPNRIVQTLGNAAASAGTHGKDGSFTNEDGLTERYSAAVDISVKHPKITVAQREKLLKALWANGFAAWYRTGPSWAGNEHIHAIFCDVAMKRSLRNQVHSFLAHRSGLVSDKADHFVRDHLSDATEQKLRAAFLSNNPMNG
jgi:hypothetical protein